MGHHFLSDFSTRIIIDSFEHPMSSDEGPTYVQILADIAKFLTTTVVTPRMKELWTKLQPFLQKNMIKNGCHHEFSKELHSILKTNIFPSQKNEGPFCSRVVHRFFTCSNCTTKDQRQGCFCIECFALQKHAGHNFRLIEGTMAVCDCGDPVSINKDGFCNKHREGKFEEPAIDPKHEQAFISQMQFLLFVLTKMDTAKVGYTDDYRKKEFFAAAIMSQIAQFIEKGYSNKYIAARLFTSKLTAFQMPDKSVLWKLTTQKRHGYFQKLKDVLLRLYTVEIMRKQVIDQIFEQLTSENGKMDVRSPLFNVMFQYANSHVEIIAALMKYGPPVINNKNLTIDERQNTFKVLFYFYRLLIEQKSDQITSQLLENLKITRLADFYFPKLQKSHRILFFNMEVGYFEAMIPLLKAIIQLERKDYLINVIKDCFTHIKKKVVSPCFSVERTFALAFFAFVNYDLENIIDMEQDILMQLLGEKDEESVVLAIESALRKSLAILKMDNIIDLKRLIYCNVRFKHNHHMFSADHIYLKILFYFLMRLQPTINTVLEPLSSYIDSRMRALDILLELFKAQEISKLEETIEMYFYEFASVASHLVYLSETSIYELIATCSLNPNKVSKPSAFEFLEFVTYVFEPAQMKDLRSSAIAYINNDKIIEQFVRTAYQPYKEMAIRGNSPKNYFNISYSSFYLQFKGFKEASSMYELKLRNYCRTQLSRYIFNQEILDRLFRLFSYMFDVFLQYFQNNEVINSKLIMSSAVECAILLALETKDTRFDNLALKFQEQYELSTKLGSNSSSEYFRELVLMYKQSQKQLTLERQRVPIKPYGSQASKKIHEKAALKIKKLNELKERQRNVLANNKASLELPPETQLKQSVHCCTICKDTSSKEYLFYLCHMRFSNFIKTTNFIPERKTKPPGFPILVTSTCGHAVHMLCLKRYFDIPQNEDNLLFDIDCFFCKASSNTIFPIASQHHSLKETFDKYLVIFQKVVGSLITERETITRFFDLEKFKLQELLISSLAQTIYEYGIQFPKYFVTKLLPVIREEFRFLMANNKKFDFISILCQLQGLVKEKQIKAYDQKGVLWLKMELIQMIQFGKTFEEIKYKIDSSFALPESHRAASERLAMIMNEISSKQPLDSFDLVTKYQLKDNYHAFIHLPEDLLEFNAHIGKCPTCKKITSKIQICMACGFKTCESCYNEVKDHIKLHLGSCVFAKVQNGHCLLYFQDRCVPGIHLYLNYAGDPIPSSKLFPTEGEYTLSIENRNNIFQLILDDTIRLEVSSKGDPHCQVQ